MKKHSIVLRLIAVLALLVIFVAKAKPVKADVWPVCSWRCNSGVYNDRRWYHVISGTFARECICYTPYFYSCEVCNGLKWAPPGLTLFSTYGYANPKFYFTLVYFQGWGWIHQDNLMYSHG